jgi:hypothetical protein
VSRQEAQPQRDHFGGLFIEGKDLAIIMASLDRLYERSLSDPGAMARLRKALRAPSKLASQFGKVLATAAHETAPSVLRDLKRAAPAMLRRRHEDFSGFEKRLQASWRRPLDLLEMLIVVCTEAGDALNQQWQWKKKSREENLVFEVVRRLHARACQVASEILCLLQSGFAPAAHARWRTLHETNVTAHFIADRGGDVAERFLLHEHIEALRAAEQIQTYAKRLRERPFSRSEMSRLRRTRDQLEKQFGAEFRHPYGWAAATLQMKKPTFSDIEAPTKLDHLRPYYKMASYSVHATVKSIRFSLALLPGHDVLLTGASNAGLEIPGHSAALSLAQITMTMTMLHPSSDTIVIGRVAHLFEGEIGAAFLVAARRLKAKDREARRKLKQRRAAPSRPLHTGNERVQRSRRRGQVVKASPGPVAAKASR